MIIVLLASVTVATRWRCSADPGASPRWAASSKSEPNRVLEPLRIDPTRSCCRQIGANARVFKRNGGWSRCPYRDSAADHTLRLLNDVRTADSEQSSQPTRPASPASALGVKRRSPVGLGLRRRGPAREAEQQQLRLGARSVRHGHHHADGRFGVWRRGTAGAGRQDPQGKTGVLLDLRAVEQRGAHRNGCRTSKSFSIAATASRSFNMRRDFSPTSFCPGASPLRVPGPDGDRRGCGIGVGARARPARRLATAEAGSTRHAAGRGDRVPRGFCCPSAGVTFARPGTTRDPY